MAWKPSSDRLCVAVLSGGDSPERDISLASGRCVRQALVEAGHEAGPWDPAEIDLSLIPWSRYDACFIALHGGAGEDGRIQRRLKLLKIPYTGSGLMASRLAMSKSASKERFRQSGVNTPPYVLLDAADKSPRATDKAAPLGYPLVIKPDSQGSSLGVGVAHTASDVVACLAECLRLERFAIAEPLVRGREFTVTVIDREPLPAIEIVAAGGVFDYAAKYSSTTTQYRFDVKLPSHVTDGMYQSAVAAGEALGATGLFRVDMILDDDQTAWVLEVNTVPGLTDKSLAPRAAAKAGMDMPRLCDRLVRLCFVQEMTS